MHDITAIILAAGRGIRMGRRGELMPKGLLRLGGRTLVEQSVVNLRARGIRRIRIITGHLREMYEEEARHWGGGIELVANDGYAQSGSLASLTLGLEGVEGPCVVLESDLIYEPRALAPLGAEKPQLVLSGPTGAGDEVYVWAQRAPDGSFVLRDMSKKLQHRAEPHHGELVGILYLTQQATGEMRQAAGEVLGREPRADYEAGLVALARNVPVVCPRFDDLAWAEIDDEAMFRHAAEKVYPRIAAAEFTSAAPG